MKSEKPLSLNVTTSPLIKLSVNSAINNLISSHRILTQIFPKSTLQPIKIKPQAAEYIYIDQVSSISEYLLHYIEKYNKFKHFIRDSNQNPIFIINWNVIQSNFDIKSWLNCITDELGLMLLIKIDYFLFKNYTKEFCEYIKNSIKIKGGRYYLNSIVFRNKYLYTCAYLDNTRIIETGGLYDISYTNWGECICAAIENDFFPYILLYSNHKSVFTNENLLETYQIEMITQYLHIMVRLNEPPCKIGWIEKGASQYVGEEKFREDVDEEMVVRTFEEVFFRSSN
ncbi:hypothetical protein SteCoe_8853 [Stentor coeruleus]|uniref:Uncharacterized protein n=1 Tax=Stentor coeruleus TaxID=5963 RepID=A0A1R2CJ19_9CILI|nr:hypothetical protein SteCoe_8853 [Stentor coeruleus]